MVREMGRDPTMRERGLGWTAKSVASSKRVLFSKRVTNQIKSKLVNKTSGFGAVKKAIPYEFATILSDRVVGLFILI